MSQRGFGFFGRRIAALAGLLLVAASVGGAEPAVSGERHYLYVAEPGVRDYVEWGGAGILVFDMDNGTADQRVRRIGDDVVVRLEP